MEGVAYDDARDIEDSLHVGQNLLVGLRAILESMSAMHTGSQAMKGERKTYLGLYVFVSHAQAQASRRRIVVDVLGVVAERVVDYRPLHRDDGHPSKPMPIASRFCAEDNAFAVDCERLTLTHKLETRRQLDGAAAILALGLDVRVGAVELLPAHREDRHDCGWELCVFLIGVLGF